MIANALIGPAPAPRTPAVASSSSGTDFDRHLDSASKAVSRNRDDARAANAHKASGQSSSAGTTADAKAADTKVADKKAAEAAGKQPVTDGEGGKAPAHTGELPAELVVDAPISEESGEVLPEDLLATEEPDVGEAADGEATDSDNPDGEDTNTAHTPQPPADGEAAPHNPGDASATASANAGATGASAVSNTSEGESANQRPTTTTAAPVTSAHGKPAEGTQPGTAAPASAATTGAAQAGTTGASAGETQPRAEATPTAAPVAATTSSQATTAAPASTAPAAHPPPQPLPAQIVPQLAHLRQLPQGQHVLTITVNPEHYGPLRVVATITPEGTSMHLISPTEAGREALRGSLADLRRDMADAGFEGDFDLDLGTEAETHDDAPAGADTDGQPLGRAVRLTEPDSGAVTPPTINRASQTSVDLYL